MSMTDSDRGEHIKYLKAIRAEHEMIAVHSKTIRILQGKIECLEKPYNSVNDKKCILCHKYFKPFKSYYDVCDECLRAKKESNGGL